MLSYNYAKRTIFRAWKTGSVMFRKRVPKNLLREPNMRENEGCSPTKYNLRAKDARPRMRTAWRGWIMIEFDGSKYRNKTGNFQLFKKYLVGDYFYIINSAI